MRTVSCVWILIGTTGLAAGPTCRAAEGRAADLQSPLAAVRVFAAQALGRSGDRTAVPALIAALRDEEAAVRREAAKALGALKDARAVTALIAALQDRDTNVRFYAAYALGEIKDAQATAALLAALRDPQWCVRDQAAWALREIRDPQLAGPLAEALRDPRADVSHIVWLLRQLGGPQASAPLTALLADEQPETRRRAVQALSELKDAAVVEPLLGRLNDADPAVRRRVVETVLKLGGDRVEQPLRDRLAREDDPAVREVLEKGLLRLSPEAQLAAHWSFDDGHLQVAKDVTGHGNDGEIRGCAPVPGKVGQALRFGKGRYIELGRPAGLPIADRPFTVMAWIKTGAASGVVVARGGAFCGYSLYLKDGAARFGLRRDQEGPTSIAASREPVGDAWVHLAGVVHSDRLELYVNGKLAATVKTAGYIPGNCGQGMEIGYDAGNSAAEITDPLEGLIDEVKIYHAALSESEIGKASR